MSSSGAQKTNGRNAAIDLDTVNVLVVDGHPGMRRVWFALLHAFGIRQISQTDVYDGVGELIRERKIDILITDFRIGAVDCTETVRAIRSASVDPIRFLPIIACTASTHPATIWRLVECGVDEVLAKPISTRDAVRKMEAVINHRRPFIATKDYFGPAYRKPPAGGAAPHAGARGAPMLAAPTVGELRGKLAEHQRKLMAETAFDV